MRVKNIMKKINIDKKRIGILFVCIVSIYMLFIQLRSQDDYVRDYYQTQMFDSYVEAEETTVYSGQLIGKMFLNSFVYPGEYDFLIEYESDSPNAYVEIYDEIKNCQIETGILETDQSQIIIHANIKKYVNELTMRTYGGTSGKLKINSVQMRSNGSVYKDTFWKIASILIYFAGMFVVIKIARKRQDLFLTILYLLASILSVPLLGERLQYGHDIGFHLGRIAGMAEAMQAGQFPVRIGLEMENGVGHLASVLYPDFFLYGSAIICNLGASIVFAFKILCIMINFATVFLSFFAMKSVTDKKIAFIFTLLWSVNPYRLNDFFVRAALGEYLAITFVPLAAVGIWQLVKGDYKKGFWQALIGISCIVQSHVITTMMVAVFAMVYVIGYVLLNWKIFFADKKRIGTIFTDVGVCVLLNLWFLYPFLSFFGKDMYIRQNDIKVSQNAVEVFQAFMNTNISEWVNNNLSAGTALTIGAAIFLGTILFIVVYIERKQLADGNLIEHGLIYFFMGSFAVFMSSTAFPWKELEKFSIIQKTLGQVQFAWRYLLAAVFFFSLISSIAVAELLKFRNKAVATGICTGLLIIGIMNLFQTQVDYMQGICMMDGADACRIVYANQDYIETRYNIGELRNQVAEGIITDNVQMDSYDREGLEVNISFTKEKNVEGFIRIPIENYGFYKAQMDDGRKIELKSDEKSGLIKIIVPPNIESGKVKVYYSQPKRYVIANIISVITAVALVMLGARNRKSRWNGEM